MAKWIGLFLLIHILSILLLIALSAVDVFNDGIDFVLKIHAIFVLLLSFYFFLKKDQTKAWANIIAYLITLIIGLVVFILLFLQGGYMN